MSTAAILVGAKTETLLRQLSSLWGYFSIRLSVCLSICLSFWLHVCLFAQQHSPGPWVIKSWLMHLICGQKISMRKSISITMAMEARCQFWIWKIRIWVSAAVICKHGAMGPVIALAYRGFCLCRQCFGYVRLWVASPPKQQGIYQSTGVCSYVQKHVIGCVSWASPGVSRL